MEEVGEARGARFTSKGCHAAMLISFFLKPFGIVSYKREWVSLLQSEKGESSPVCFQDSVHKHPPLPLLANSEHSLMKKMKVPNN